MSAGWRKIIVWGGATVVACVLPIWAGTEAQTIATDAVVYLAVAYMGGNAAEWIAGAVRRQPRAELKKPGQLGQ